MRTSKAAQIQLMADQEYIDYMFGLFSYEEIEEAIREKKNVRVRKHNPVHNSFCRENIDTSRPEVWSYVKRTADL